MTEQVKNPSLNPEQLNVAINSAESYPEMAKIALIILNSMEDPVVELCGPITTGGLGSIEKNLERFDKKIKELKNNGINVFDQIPFEIPIQKLKLKPDFKPIDLLEGLYLPLLESGKIKVYIFFPIGNLPLVHAGT